MANEKLDELALDDLKCVKRTLANRKSAARSKEKKMRYLMELEHKCIYYKKKIQICWLLQRESMGLVSWNNELRIHLEALHQQSQLQNGLLNRLWCPLKQLWCCYWYRINFAVICGF